MCLVLSFGSTLPSTRLKTDKIAKDQPGEKRKRAGKKTSKIASKGQHLGFQIYGLSLQPRELIPNMMKPRHRSSCSIMKMSGSHAAAGAMKGFSWQVEVGETVWSRKDLECLYIT